VAGVEAQAPAAAGVDEVSTACCRSKALWTPSQHKCTMVSSWQGSKETLATDRDLVKCRHLALYLGLNVWIIFLHGYVGEFLGRQLFLINVRVIFIVVHRADGRP